MPKILSSKLRTPDGTVLHSKHRHDFVIHIDANGKKYILDGGCDYVRVSANGDEKLLTVMSDGKHEVIREAVTWGTYGKTGDQPLKYVAIADMETEHLQACVDTQIGSMRPALLKVMQNEMNYRDARKLKV